MDHSHEAGACHQKHFLAMLSVRFIDASNNTLISTISLDVGFLGTGSHIHSFVLLTHLTQYVS